MVTAKQKSIIDIDTKRKRDPNITLKIVIKSQENKRRKGKKSYKNKSKTINKIAVRRYVSIVTLNVKGLNVPKPKDTGWLKWIQKQYPNICCLQETHFRPRYTDGE